MLPFYLTKLLIEALVLVLDRYSLIDTAHSQFVAIPIPATRGPVLIVFFTLNLLAVHCFPRICIMLQMFPLATLFPIFETIISTLTNVWLATLKVTAHVIFFLR